MQTNADSLKCIAWQPHCVDGSCSFGPADCALAVPMAHMVGAQEVRMPHSQGEDVYLCMRETDGERVVIHGAGGVVGRTEVCSLDRMNQLYDNGLLVEVKVDASIEDLCDVGSIPVLNAEDGTITCQAVGGSGNSGGSSSLPTTSSS